MCVLKLGDTVSIFGHLKHQQEDFAAKENHPGKAKISSALSQGEKREKAPNHHSSGPINIKIADMWDLPGTKRLLGLGQMDFVLKNIRFKTKREPFGLNIPSTRVKDLDAMEKIIFPEVPPEVLEKTNIEDQVQEMREWFKAWQNQDDSVRKYKYYFKGVLCYLEGSWMNTQNKPRTIFMQFLSKHIGALNYKNGKYRSLVSKEILELIVLKSHAVEWKYLVKCVPLCKDLPLHKLKLIDDIAMRKTYGITMEEFPLIRSARFQSAAEDNDYFDDGDEKGTKQAFLDILMRDVPGKDNFPANISQDVSNDSPQKHGRKPPLGNLGYYHKRSKIRKSAGTTNISNGLRVFGDDNPYLARNTRPEVSAMGGIACNSKIRKLKRANPRWSYAVPIEVVYLTPLSRWNPYGVRYHGNASVGGDGQDMPLDGANDTLYYLTPLNFFEKNDGTFREGDIARVNDGGGHPQVLVGSGMRTVTPAIPGVGRVRLRYPIIPIYKDGTKTDI